MCVRMQGNEDTTVVASGILGSFKFLSKTLGLQGMYTILCRASRRRRVSGVGAEVPGLLLLISWRGIYKWDTGVHHSNVPRDLVPGSCFQFHPLSCAFVLYLMAY